MTSTGCKTDVVRRYDQTLYEDSDINRMNEAAGLFESISNSRYAHYLSLLVTWN